MAREFECTCLGFSKFAGEVCQGCQINEAIKGALDEERERTAALLRLVIAHSTLDSLEALLRVPVLGDALRGVVPNE